MANADSHYCFLGDVVCPEETVAYAAAVPVMAANNVVVNLEGAFPPDQGKRPNGVYSSTKLLDVLSAWNVKVACLANNHLLDVNPYPSHTSELLQSREIKSCGGGDNASQAERYVMLDTAGTQTVFLAFGWEVISCQPAGLTNSGVNSLNTSSVLQSVSKCRLQHPKAKIVVMLHWNYELEIYPLPAQRILAKKVIAAGADAIIGHHPHCVQGIEYFSGKPVVYSLGNWFFPHGNYYGFDLRFPQFTNLQLAFEWCANSGDDICHLYHFSPQHNSVTHLESGWVDDLGAISKLSEFAKVSLEDYPLWFRKNRRQRKILPIYKSFDTTIPNCLRDYWVKQRHQLVQLRSKLRKLRSPDQLLK